MQFLRLHLEEEKKSVTGFTAKRYFKFCALKKSAKGWCLCKVKYQGQVQVQNFSRREKKKHLKRTTTKRLRMLTKFLLISEPRKVIISPNLFKITSLMHASLLQKTLTHLAMTQPNIYAMFFWKWNSVFIILLSPIPLTLIYAKHLFLTPLMDIKVDS